MKISHNGLIYGRFLRLNKKLTDVGLILQGTITTRTISVVDPKQAESKKLLGPYYQWTFKKKGKTITINLTTEQSKFYQKAINNYRKMQVIIRKMLDTSLDICNKQFVGVSKRQHK